MMQPGHPPPAPQATAAEFQGLILLRMKMLLHVSILSLRHAGPEGRVSVGEP